MKPQQKYDRSDIRRLNAVNVLEQLHRNGAQSRAGIAGALGLTRATVSNIVNDLMEASLIKETEFDERGAGRPGLLLTLNPQSGSMIAMDIDVDRLSLVTTDTGREILWREQIPIKAATRPEATLSTAAQMVREGLRKSESRGLACHGIGVAWAGLVNRGDGQLEYGPTSGWGQIPLRRDWERLFNVPVFVENEAHAGAIGTHLFGIRPGVRNLIYLSLGVGLAAGIYVDGTLLRGKQGFAGQVGHTHFRENGITCSCGKSGCWVTEIGAQAIKRKLQAAGMRFPSRVGPGFDWVEWVRKRCEDGDPSPTRVLQGIGLQLGAGLTRLIQTFNPSLVVVGGRLGSLMQPAEEKILDVIRSETLPCMTDPLEVKISRSDEDALDGCLATVFDALIKNPPIR